MTESNPSAYSSTNSGRLATGDETENFLGGVWGHVGWVFEQHGLLADVLAHGRGVGNRRSLHSFLPNHSISLWRHTWTILCLWRVTLSFEYVYLYHLLNFWLSVGFFKQVIINSGFPSLFLNSCSNLEFNATKVLSYYKNVSNFKI